MAANRPGPGERQHDCADRADAALAADPGRFLELAVTGETMWTCFHVSGNETGEKASVRIPDPCRSALPAADPGPHIGERRSTSPVIATGSVAMSRSRVARRALCGHRVADGKARRPPRTAVVRPTSMVFQIERMVSGLRTRPRKALASKVSRISNKLPAVVMNSNRR